jgi:hypothetical protein
MHIRGVASRRRFGSLFNCWSGSRLCSISKLSVELSGSMGFSGFCIMFPGIVYIIELAAGSLEGTPSLEKHSLLSNQTTSLI